MPTTVVYVESDPEISPAIPGEPENNSGWEGSDKNESMNRAQVNSDFWYQWNIQVTCILLIGAVGIFILVAFLVSLYCGRRAFRKMQLNIVKPSRLKAMWTNIRVIPFRPVVMFRRPQSSPGFRGSSKPQTIHVSDSAPIFHSAAITEDMSEYADALEDQDVEASSTIGDGFSTPAEIDYKDSPLENKEDYIMYKVIAT